MWTEPNLINISPQDIPRRRQLSAITMDRIGSYMVSSLNRRLKSITLTIGRLSLMRHFSAWLYCRQILLSLQILLWVLWFNECSLHNLRWSPRLRNGAFFSDNNLTITYWKKISSPNFMKHSADPRSLSSRLRSLWLR